MWRWQPFLGSFLCYAPMDGLWRSGFPLGRSRRLPLVVWHLPLSWSWSAEDKVVLSITPWRSGFSLFVLEHFFFLGMGHGFDMKCAGVTNSFGPTIAPQNPAVRLLGRGEGFWCSWTYVMAGRASFSQKRQGLFVCPRHAPGVSVYEARCH